MIKQAKATKLVVELKQVEGGLLPAHMAVAVDYVLVDEKNQPQGPSGTYPALSTRGRELVKELFIEVENSVNRHLFGTDGNNTATSGDTKSLVPLKKDE